MRLIVEWNDTADLGYRSSVNLAEIIFRTSLALWSLFFFYGGVIAGWRARRTLVVNQAFSANMRGWFVGEEVFRAWRDGAAGRSMPWGGLFGGMFERDELTHDRLWWPLRCLHAFLGVFSACAAWMTSPEFIGGSVWPGLILFAALMFFVGVWFVRRVVRRITGRTAT